MLTKQVKDLCSKNFVSLRELGEREGEKRRGEENMREQEVWVRGKIEESKKRDTIIEGATIGLKRNLDIGKSPEIYKDDPN